MKFSKYPGGRSPDSSLYAERGCVCFIIASYSLKLRTLCTNAKMSSQFSEPDLEMRINALSTASARYCAHDSLNPHARGAVLLS